MCREEMAEYNFRQIENQMKASCGIRAHDLPLTERVLYQLS